MDEVRKDAGEPGAEPPPADERATQEATIGDETAPEGVAGPRAGRGDGAPDQGEEVEGAKGSRGGVQKRNPELLTDCRIHRQVRDHQLATPWVCLGEAELLGIWSRIFQEDLFEDDFDILCPEFSPLRGQDLCRYHRGRNSFGARHGIVFNTRCLDRPLHERLAALAPAMLEQREVVLTGRHGTARYRSAWVARQCDLYGIPFERGYGHFIREFRPPFRTLLESHGVEFRMASEPLSKPTRLPLWGCDCAQFRVKEEIDYHCNRCGAPVKRLDLEKNSEKEEESGPT